MPSVAKIMQILDETADGSWMNGTEDPLAQSQTPEQPRLGSRSQVFDSLFGNGLDQEWPRVSERFRAVQKIKNQLTPEVYASCLENICTSMLYEPDNI